MPTTKSAKKRLRQNVVRRTRNRSARSVLRNHVRKVREAVARADVDAATQELRLAARKLDQAAARGIIHHNAAARLKSRLSAAVKAIKTKNA